MENTKKLGGLDLARLVAAFLVVAIHISPLENLNPEADFFLTGVLARLAVPLFLMISGYFVLSSSASARPFLKKIALLYLFSVLLYLPIGIYAGHYEELSAPELLRMLFLDGTFYHLWYFPALLLGILILSLLKRIPKKGWITAAVIVLYLLGLLGDGYWGLTQEIPYLSSAYEGYFSVSTYTRGGLFYAPIFLWLGVLVRESRPLKKTVCVGGTVFSFAMMSAEAFLLRSLGWQRHTSMYLLLPVCMFFLFRLLTLIPMQTDRRLRGISTWIYLLHPAVIVGVRLMAKLTGTGSLLVDRLPIHYLVVCLLSLAIALLVVRIRLPKRAEPEGRGRAWVELDRKALRHNVTLLQNALPEHCELMPAVKANAYGHGVQPIARALNEMGIKAFCVASLAEGVELRKNGIRGEILVLGYTDVRDLPLLRHYDLIQTVVDSSYAKMLEQFRKPLRVHVALDTGMRRLGERCDDMDAIVSIFETNNLRIEGVFTHLCADDTDREADVEFTKKQIETFEQTVGDLRRRGYKIPKIHIQASYGVLNYPSPAGDYARVGIALYGVRSQREDLDRLNPDLKPVLSLKARIATVKTLKAGEPAGYGLAFVAERDMRIATLAIGYADGVPRALSCGVGEVLINGHRAPIIGRVCMDQLTVDVTKIPDVKQGDVAVLIGQSQNEEISVYDWATKCNTLTNEILCRMGERPPRIIQ